MKRCGCRADTQPPRPAHPPNDGAAATTVRTIMARHASAAAAPGRSLAAASASVMTPVGEGRGGGGKPFTRVLCVYPTHPATLYALTAAAAAAQTQGHTRYRGLEGLCVRKGKTLLKKFFFLILILMRVPPILHVRARAPFCLRAQYRKLSLAQYLHP